MKKFIIFVCAIVLTVLLWDFAHNRLGVYVDTVPDGEVTAFVRTQGKDIYLDNKKFEIKGVNLGSGIPGEWSTDYAIDEETYLRWFRQIQDMGANTIRVYTIQADTFYNAFYRYNRDNPQPLYLLQGVWVNDYILDSHRDAYSGDIYPAFVNDCKTMVDVIHGQRKLALGRMASAGSGTYDKDVSQWVLGYILGVDWPDTTVAYTDDRYRDDAVYGSYQGTYLCTALDASPFEAMLARVGDQTMEYETQRYKQQRLLAFSNWTATDPFVYPQNVTEFFSKCARVDTEHIQATDALLSGQFASYHVSPGYPDYLRYVEDWTPFGLGEKHGGTYGAYLQMLNNHHTMPVVIAEFGIASGRGMADQKQVSEAQQAQELLRCYGDIQAAGCAGGIVLSWQDEWNKRTWNTMYAVDTSRSPYWSDYQTNGQSFGLLAFDPGETESVCYVDGDRGEWTQEDAVLRGLSMKYDEKYLYFLVETPDVSKTVYIPIDLTPKSGSNYCENFDLRFDRSVDFLLVLDGKENSRVLVQERYDALRSTYSQDVYGFDTYTASNRPDRDSPLFVDIRMILQTAVPQRFQEFALAENAAVTGLLTYGNGNPESPDFHSLADFCYGDGFIELRIPWQLLNFADPSRMEIHDDYYENYGVEYIFIKKLWLGLTDGADVTRCSLTPVPMKGWKNKVTYHERLKSAYYALQEIWN